MNITKVPTQFSTEAYAAARDPDHQFFVVSVITDKGGAGKSTLAQCLAAGMRDHDGAGVYVLTDNRLLLTDERWYDILNGQDPEVLRGYVNHARSVSERGLLVIDGAGGNQKADAWYAETLCDLTLIPMTPDEEAMACAVIYAKRFPKAIVVPNRWSTNANAARVDQDFIDHVVSEIGADRVFPPLPSVHSVNEFTRSDFRGEILPVARSFCRLFTGAVLSKLADIQSQQGGAE